MFRWIVVFLLLLIALPAAAQEPTRAGVAPQVMQQLRAGSPARVIVTVRVPNERRASIAQSQTRVLSAAAGSGFTPGYQYQTVPAFSATVADAAALNRLTAHPDVLLVEADLPGGGHMETSLQAIGADQAQDLGYTGAGVLVGVLDSGIDTNHPDLVESIVGQYCILRQEVGCTPDGGGSGNVQVSNNAEDEHGHGTHVTGTITSDGDNGIAPRGFAPDAGVVAVRVLDRYNSGWVSDWTAGLDWLNANYATYPVDIINMSLGTNARYTSVCDTRLSAFYQAVKNLTDRGVIIFASTGNQADKTAISAPTCFSNVVAVGATYDSNVGRVIYNSYPCRDETTAFAQVTCFTNSNDLLDIVAPGAPIRSAYIGNQSRTFYGTSMASPTAAGVAALMLQANPALTADQILEMMLDTGPTVEDRANDVEIPHLDALGAVLAAQELGRYDVNRDGILSSADMDFVVARLGNLSSESQESATSDINRDGRVSPTDVVTLFNYIAAQSASR